MAEVMKTSITDKGYKRIATAVGLKKGQEDEYLDVPMEEEDENPWAEYVNNAEELKLWVDNDGETYTRYTVPIQKNLFKKLQRGVYDSSKAVQGFMYAVDFAAKEYVRQLDIGMPWHKMFDKATRTEVAGEMVAEFEDLVDSGELTAENLY